MTHPLLSIIGAGLVTLASAQSSFAVDQAEIRLFQETAADIGAALATAEGATGGIATEAEFDDKKGRGVWEIKTITGTTRTEVRIDAATGEIIRRKDKGDISRKKRPVTPDMLGAPLIRLIEQAEAAAGGKVMQIEPEQRRDGAIRFEIDMLMPDGRVREFDLDPASGRLRPD